MTVWLLVAVVTTYDCPWGLGKAPEPLKTLVCRAERRAEVQGPFPDRSEALRAISSPDQALWQVVRERGRVWKRQSPVRWIPQ